MSALQLKPQRVVKVTVLLLVMVVVLGVLASCQARSQGGSEQAAAATTPIPTLAPIATVSIPTVGQVTGQGAKANGTPGAAASIDGRTYVGEVRVKDQVSVSPKVAGRIQEVKVDVGDHVKVGDVIAVMDTTTQQGALAQANAQLAAAQANLANVKAPPRAVDVNQAQAAVSIAQAGLAKLQAGATDEDKEQARLRVEQSKNQLLSLQGQRDAVCGVAGSGPKTGPGKTGTLAAQGQCDSMRGQVQAAEQAIQIAEQAYQKVLNGPTEEDINQAQAQIDQAKAGVTRAQQGATKEQIAAAAAQVDVAQAAVDNAQQAINDATITAPMDGTVSARSAIAGAYVTTGGNGIVTIISDDSEVSFDVESSLIGQIATGQPVSITVDAYPGTTFKGAISRISPTADTTTRTFRVTAKPDDSAHKLRPGMFTNVTIGGQ
ncbi:MAG: efflux RND transporter periplasmic adaptor subunit [Anaerolineae bacterium]